jgi:SAM-dependent methyltransferase
MSEEFLHERKATIKNWLELEGTVGLEIAPNWVPLISKEEANIHYCDRISYKDLVEREKDNPDRKSNGLSVASVDFVWSERKQLSQCTPIKFDYILSSHVLEHVPDFLGFLYQQRACLNDNGIIAFVLPDTSRMGEYFRPTTTASQIINAYYSRSTNPNPGQVYEALKYMLDVGGITDFTGKQYTDFKNFYSDKQIIDFINLARYKYLDVHCWAFTVNSFPSVMKELKDVGLFDFDIVDIKSGETALEFYVKLKPTHAPRKPMPHPLRQYVNRAAKVLKRIKIG